MISITFFGIHVKINDVYLLQNMQVHACMKFVSIILVSVYLMALDLKLYSTVCEVLSRSTLERCCRRNKKESIIIVLLFVSVLL